MKNIFTLPLLMLPIISCVQPAAKNNRVEAGKIEIEWVENLPGDFSFVKEWSYQEGVYKNEFGQLSCDGICPPEIDPMKDDKGKILEDKLTAFYKLVDTTHQFHSIKSEAKTYEWAGTDFITAIVSRDTVTCITQNNAATHSSLHLTIANDKVVPTIILNSVATGEKIYTAISGSMKIDQGLWNHGTMKASFDFKFTDDNNSKEPMFWKGNIYVPIEGL